MPLLLGAHRVHETVLGEESGPGMEFCSNRLLESFVAVSDLEPGTANHFPCSPAQRTLLCKTSSGGRGQIVVCPISVIFTHAPVTKLITTS